MRKPIMIVTAATMFSAAALSFGPAQATPIAPASVATAAQSTSAIQNVGWGWHRRYWGWRRPYWRWHHPWHHRDWRWRHRWW